MTKVEITSNITVGKGQKLLIIAGPCQIESKDHTFMMAEKLKAITKKYPVNFVFKSSYDKANRTSLTGARGVGIDEGLKILNDIKKEFNVPVITDIHLPEQAGIVSEVVDILQIPAFLCRQTDLLIAAGKTGKVVNIKKGQFLAAADMEYAAKKVSNTRNDKILLCERGTCFGYRDLIVDFRNFQIMQEFGYPVVFDATHSVQLMGGAGGKSAGNRQFIQNLSLAAIVAGVDALFLEVHDNPDKAPSDSANMLTLEQFENTLKKAIHFYELQCES